MELTGFDYVVIMLVGLLGLGGLMRGLTQEAISLAGWIGAVLVVRFFHEDLTGWLAPRTGGEAAGAIIAFLLLFFGTILAARILAGTLGGLTRKSVIGPIDRVLGLGFGALKGVLLSAALFLLLQFGTGLFDPARQSPAWLMESRSAPFLALAAGTMVGWVQDIQKADPGGFDLPGAAIPGLPPGHPALPGFPGQPEGPRLPPGHPLLEGRGDEGYSPEDREALDRLLDEQAKEEGEVRI
jgi:membrane protein required for colicin V production